MDRVRSGLRRGTVVSNRAQPSRCGLIFLVGTTGDNLQRVVRATVAAAPSPHPTARASRRRALAGDVEGLAVVGDAAHVAVIVTPAGLCGELL
jgi:hypothetical protein